MCLLYARFCGYTRLRVSSDADGLPEVIRLVLSSTITPTTPLDHPLSQTYRVFTSLTLIMTVGCDLISGLLTAPMVLIVTRTSRRCTHPRSFSSLITATASPTQSRSTPVQPSRSQAKSESRLVESLVVLATSCLHRDKLILHRTILSLGYCVHALAHSILHAL